VVVLARSKVVVNGGSTGRMENQDGVCGVVRVGIMPTAPRAGPPYAGFPHPKSRASNPTPVKSVTRSRAVEIAIGKAKDLVGERWYDNAKGKQLVTQKWNNFVGVLEQVYEVLKCGW
ncbi:hypothetical protein M8C21_005976, partial [Ambrosia artemisiifolia]